MADFTAGALSFPRRPLPTTGNESFDRRIQELVSDWGCGPSSELVREMVITALKMGHDDLSIADLKLFNRSQKELRYAAKIFAPYSKIRKVVVFGSARTPQDAPEAIAAETFARTICSHNYMVITG
ncbi:MAG: cytochrome D ubiquinol oxidase subunit II, partial [Verrucomicrobiota bacterium]